MAKSVQVAIIQTASPEYRFGVWRQLTELSDGCVQVYAGAEFFDPTVRTPPTVGNEIRRVRNLFLLRRRLAFQLLPLSLLATDVVVAEASARVLSTWALLAARRILGRPTLLWGHLFSKRTGQWSRPSSAMRRLCDGYICYTEADARVLQADRSFHRPVVAAPNALARASSIAARPGVGATNFVYVGRMIAAKRPDLLLNGFLAAAPSLPPECRLIMVGAGPLSEELRAKARASAYGSRISFLGHVTDPDILKGIYGGALASVSPGYVGLSIIQSLGFGVPMIVADNEPHSPEIEAAHDGVTSVTFLARSDKALADALRKVWRDRRSWYAKAPQIAALCSERYSLEALASTVWRAAVDAAA